MLQNVCTEAGSESALSLDVGECCWLLRLITPWSIKKAVELFFFILAQHRYFFFSEVWVFRKTLGKHEKNPFFSGMEVDPKLCRATVQKRHEILVFVCPFCWFLWLCSKIHDHIKVNETNKMNFFIPGLFLGVCLCWRCIFVVGWLVGVFGRTECLKNVNNSSAVFC